MQKTPYCTPKVVFSLTIPRTGFFPFGDIEPQFAVLVIKAPFVHYYKIKSRVRVLAVVNCQNIGDGG